jgi:hypothetical protein
MNFRKIILISFVLLNLNYVKAQGQNSEEKTEKTIQDLGDYLHIGMPIAAGLTTIILGDKEGSWQFVKGFAVNLAATYALKYTINKPRPEGATDGHAFPSGHTSVAFQSASFIQRRYGWDYGIPAYALASFVAYSRLEGYNDRHDGWDVLGGIVVGIGSTYLFTTPYEKEHLELSFNSSKNSYLLGLTFKF